MKDRMAIDMATKRFERLEKAQRGTHDRLEKVEDTLGRVADILESHTAHYQRIENALFAVSDRVDLLADRVDRLATAIIRGRTQDLEGFAEHERRLRALEPKRPRKRR